MAGRLVAWALVVAAIGCSSGRRVWVAGQDAGAPGLAANAACGEVERQLELLFPDARAGTCARDADCVARSAPCGGVGVPLPGADGCVVMAAGAAQGYGLLSAAHASYHCGMELCTPCALGSRCEAGRCALDRGCGAYARCRSQCAGAPSGCDEHTTAATRAAYDAALACAEGACLASAGGPCVAPEGGAGWADGPGVRAGACDACLAAALRGRWDGSCAQASCDPPACAAELAACFGT